ncbi:Cytochrome c551 peroxidase precursor [Anatilimnocola aggregata]|uniref:Cytochrome c551 peroxidase n=1 Tax=Anatilimnocola aggregata TaxID=2528021 RepID=A0A517Y549_9BACT|nr:cytochrome c peroxidase [Anatilimnocola aggregata]QDU25355.1 Cytochrome c551 peroxidase precursor [Anatilimnocola aggregata]
MSLVSSTVLHRSGAQVSGLLVGLILLATCPAAEPAAPKLATQLRRPIALANDAQGEWLYVANRESGSITSLTAAGKVTSETAVGKQLSDFIPVPGSDLFLATDEQAHQLLVLRMKGDQITVLQRLAVSPYPVGVTVWDDGKQAAVTSLWSRRVSFLALNRNGDKKQEIARITKVLDLPFAPRKLIMLPQQQKLIVADSFSGKLAVIDPKKQTLEAVRQFPGHNIRGLGISPNGEMLLVSHQMLNELAHTIRNDVHWGLLMSNDLRWLKIESVLAGGKETYFGSHMHPLGEAGQGGGDPAGFDIATDGTVAVTMSGAGQIAVGKEEDFSLQRIEVGQRPVAVKIAADGKTALVVDQYADCLVRVDLALQEVTERISLGPTPELTEAQKGEVLFHDSRLAHDRWMSCHSCHADGHANGQMNDNFSDKSFGAPKRVLSLLSQKDTAPYGWNAKAEDLLVQIRNSLENTMQREDEIPADDVKAIAAYVSTLELPPPLDVLRGTTDSAAIARGKLVFENHDCARCHAGPNFTTPKAYDVGLTDKQGNKEFNPPSLRGLSHRGPFFHDNTAATLEDVFLKHQHPAKAVYSAEEIKDLVHYLRSL